MSLHKRQHAEQLINEYREVNWLSPIDSYEDFILKAAENDNPHESLGELLVIAAGLLEIGRKADPAYELKVVSNE